MQITTNRSEMETDRQPSDSISLAKIVNSFVPYIESKISGMNVPGLESDDLRQEAFVALFSAIESYEEGKGAVFSTYAITCINNRLADAVKTANRQKNRALNESVSLNDDEHILDVESPLSTEEAAIAREEYEAVKSKIENLLTGKEREVLLKWINGYSYDEIGSQMGISGKSVANALQRARQKLKK